MSSYASSKHLFFSNPGNQRKQLLAKSRLTSRMCYMSHLQDSGLNINETFWCYSGISSYRLLHQKPPKVFYKILASLSFNSFEE